MYGHLYILRVLRILTKSEQNTSALKMAVFLTASEPHITSVNGTWNVHETVNVLQQIPN